MSIFIFTFHTEQAILSGFDNFEEAYRAIKKERPSWGSDGSMEWEEINEPSIIFREVEEEPITE